jgi:hypothetical protein
MSWNENEAFQDELIQNYLENQATPTEEKEFRLLLGEESFRRRVAEYAIDLGCLYSHARQGMLDRTLVAQPKSNSGSCRRVIRVAVVAASFLLAVATVWAVFRNDNTPSELAHSNVGGRSGNQSAEPIIAKSLHSVTDGATRHSGIATAAHVIGRVLIGGSYDPAESRVVDEGTVLQSGDVVRTLDAESFALVEFHDGSVLAIAGESELTCALEDSRKRVMVAAGDIMAQVAFQDKLSPMVISTPIAEAEVLGTRLSVCTEGALTELAVHEGRVLFRRLLDGQTIDVSGGQCAVATSDSELVARPIQLIPSVWEEDFAAGLPDRWGCGTWIRSEGPDGSNGAVRAVPRAGDKVDQAGPCYVMTAREWSHGLFRIEEDTHLNFRYKLTRPGWFYAMVSMRTDDAIAVFAGSFIYKNRDMWQVPRNQWRTTCIPLSQFQRPEQGLPDDAIQHPPKPGDIVFSLFFRTQDQDSGLMIDRIWVTRGSPESAEVPGQFK